MSWRSRHAVSRGFERRLDAYERLVLPNAIIDKDVDVYSQAIYRFQW